MHKKLICVFILAILCIAGFAFARNIPPSSFSTFMNLMGQKILHNAGGPTTPQRYENSEPSDIFHSHSVKPDLPLNRIIEGYPVKNESGYNLYIDLSARVLHFRYGEQTLKEYSIAAGSKTRLGDKEKEGDRRTPRGEFFICTREVYSPPKGYLGSRWMLLSYPNIEAPDKGLKNGLIQKDIHTRIKQAIIHGKIPPQDTSLGSAIGIHGGARPGLPSDWTAGCIGMYDQDIEEIFDYVRPGTKVVIR